MGSLDRLRSIASGSAVAGESRQTVSGAARNSAGALDRLKSIAAGNKDAGKRTGVMLPTAAQGTVMLPTANEAAEKNAQTEYKPVSRLIEESNAAARYNAARNAVDTDRHSVNDIYSNDFAAREAERERRENNQAALDAAARQLERLGYDVKNSLGNVGRSFIGGTGAAVNGIANETSYLGQTGAAQGYVDASMDMAFWANLTGSGAAKEKAEQEHAAAVKQEQQPLSTNFHIAENYNAETARRTQYVKGAGRVVNDVAAGVGGMLPSIASSLAVPGSGLYVLFTQAAGNATEEALNAGYSDDRAVGYGLAVGGIEVLTEKMFGGIPGLGDGGVDELVKSKLQSEGAQRAVLLLMDTLGEGFEEFASEFGDKAASEFFLPGNDTRSWSEVTGDAGYSFLIGALTSAVMNLPTETVKSMRYMAPKQAADVLAAEVARQAKNSPRETRQDVRTGTDTPAGQNGAAGVTGGNLSEAVRAQIPGQSETVQRAAESFTRRTGTQSGAGEESVAAAERLSETLGRQIGFYSGGVSENGFYDNKSGTLWINSQSRNPTARVIAHELTHSVELADSYNTLQKLVLNEIQRGGWELDELRRQKAELYARNGMRMDTQAEIDAEITAEYVERNLLTDERAITRMVQTDRSLGQRILNWLRSVAARLTGNENARQRAFVDRAITAYARALDQSAETDANSRAGGTRYSIEETHDGKKYVRADRQVIFGNDPRSWGEQVENYINGKIRRGEDVRLIAEDGDVRLIAEDGDVLTLTRDTAGKITSPYKGGRTLNDVEYERKLNAGVHIDELAQISKRGNTRSDTDGRHGDFASGGWNYRTAYFQDFDGQYYKVQISVAQGKNRNVVYNIGDMKKETPPQRMMRKSGSMALGREVSADTIADGTPDVKPLSPPTLDGAAGQGQREVPPLSLPTLDEDGKRQYSISEDGEKRTAPEPETMDDFIAELTEETERSLSEPAEKAETAEAPEGTETSEAAAPDLNTPEGVTQAREDIDGYWELVGEQARRIANERGNPPEDMVSAQTRKRTKSARQNAKDAWSYFKRQMVDSGAAVDRIGRAAKDPHLYHYYNMARASTNAAVNMITSAATDIRGKKTGESLNSIFKPIRDKGADYYNAFQMYLFHEHNADRMSRYSRENAETAQLAFADFLMENPEMKRFADYQIEQMALDDNSLFQTQSQDYIRLRNQMRQAENTRNKPVFDYEVTAQDSRDAAERLLREHPEFEKLAEQVYGYIDNLNRYRVDSGLITEQEYEDLKRIYPHYVPTYRTFERGGPGKRVNTQVMVGKTIGRATGGIERLMPLHEALAKQTMNVVREGSKNRFGLRLMNTVEEKARTGSDKTKSALNEHVLEIQDYDGGFHPDTFDDLQNREDVFRQTNTFVVRDNGKLVEMTVSPALYEAVRALSPDAKESNTFTKTVRAGNDLFKRLVTGDNPVFLVRNFIRDFQDSLIYSKSLRRWLANYPQALKEIKTNGEYWQMYKALGGTYSSIFDYETGNVDEGNWFRRKVSGRVEALNEAIEQAPRLAEFMATVKQNGGLDADMDTLMEGMYNASDVTVNFGRSGTLGKKLNANYIPFLNPGIQGFDKMIRTVTETKGFKNWARLAVKAAVFGAAPAIINGLIYGDDDEWDELNDRDKDIYYLFKLKDGLWLKIPKGRTLSVMGMAADRAIDAAKGEDVDWGGFIETAASQTAPANPLQENILKAWFDADLMNTESPGRTWYGTDIESQRMQNLAPGERYDARTDAVSKWLGQTLGLSPKKINYLLDQYSGVAGDILLPLLTPTAERDMFSAAFTLDSAANNRLSNDFYDVSDELTYAKNGPEATGADRVVSRFWNKQSGGVSEINAAIREIEADESLGSKDKRDLIHAQYAIRNAAERQALDTLDAYRTAAGRAWEAGAGIEDEDDQEDYAYREANREVYGAEYALSVYNKDVYEAARELNAQGLDYGDFYDVYFGMKEAQAGLRGAAKSNAGRDVIRESGLSDRDKELLYRDRISDSRDATIQQFREAGLSFDQFLLAQNAYASINEDYTGALVKSTEFARWVNRQNLTPEQTETVKTEFTYYSQIPQEAKRYDGFIDAGLSEQEAYDLANALMELKPEPGKDSVSSLQRYQMVVQSGLAETEQMEALGVLMQDSEYRKMDVGYRYGVTPAAYVELKRILPKFDADGNGSYKQAEVTAALDSIATDNSLRLPSLGGGSAGGPLTMTTAEKAALWQIITGAKDGKSNPYDRNIGKQVYDAVQAANEDDGMPVGLTLPSFSSGTSAPGTLRAQLEGAQPRNVEPMELPSLSTQQSTAPAPGSLRDLLG